MFILEDLWAGNLAPAQRAVDPASQYHKIRHHVISAETKLRENFTQEEKALFRSYDEGLQELTDIAEREAFIQGFRIGIRMLLDAICEYPFQLPQEVDH